MFQEDEVILFFEDRTSVNWQGCEQIRHLTKSSVKLFIYDRTHSLHCFIDHDMKQNSRLNFISGHGWFFAKINVTNILLLDYFGGAATIPLQDYFKATPY